MIRSWRNLKAKNAVRSLQSEMNGLATTTISRRSLTQV